MQRLKIAVIGAGTAGLAAAAFLQKGGHEVALYEKFDDPKPLGAGLLLQPTGLSILALLGLDQQIIAGGGRIDQLYGKVSGSKSVTLDVRYRSMSPHLFGIGVHRGNLFSALYEAVLRRGVMISSSSEIVEVNGQYITSREGQSFGPFDLMIDSTGARSLLRRKYAAIKRDRPYPYGAIWAIVKNSEGSFCRNTLAQRYKHASHMIGVLPVGRLTGDAHDSAAFFWSMRADEHAGWKEQELSRWQEYVVSLWPETEPLVMQFQTHQDLTLATYSDTVLRKYYTGRLVFIGDSAHCMSPQLGQGANLALMDAWVLSECLNAASSLEEALGDYTKQRKNHIRFYQLASRMLTPFFQSDSMFFARIRFLTCGIACKIPFSQKIAAQVLSGTKTGLFSSLNPGVWAGDYDLFKCASNAARE